MIQRDQLIDVVKGRNYIVYILLYGVISLFTENAEAMCFNVLFCINAIKQMKYREWGLQRKLELWLSQDTHQHLFCAILRRVLWVTKDH